LTGHVYARGYENKPNRNTTDRLAWRDEEGDAYM